MTFNEYQHFTGTTAGYSPSTKKIFRDEYQKLGQLNYCFHGMAGEAGELNNKFKKVFRDDEGELTEKFVANTISELGDVLWYLTRIAVELGVSLEEVAEQNVLKITGRKERGTIHGSGDNR